MGLWIAVGALALLAMLPLGIRGLYAGNGAFVYLLLGFGRIQIYPGRKKKERDPKKPSRKKSASAGEHTAKPVKKGGSYQDFLPLVDIVLKFLGDFRRRLRINLLELNVTMAADDPADLAINYARAWAAVGNLMPQLERLFVIKKRSIEVQCDFTADTSLVYADVVITITLGRLLWLLMRYGYRALREYFKIKNTNKGGARI